MKQILFAAVVAAMAMGTAGCSGPKKENSVKETVQTEVTEQKAIEEITLTGTYEGTFPCADCGGKDISLTICEDGTYCLKYKYQDKDERLVEENGTYSVLDRILVETVTPSSGGKTYYKYVEGNLVLSDSLGTVDNGELAELYILRKKNQK